jgi:ribose/xylose/arabinose/galactoside ABC-type transport system permease subunit
MTGALIGLIFLIIIVGVVVWIVLQLVAMLPMDAGFQNIAKGLIIIVAILIIAYKALPLLGIPVP